MPISNSWLNQSVDAVLAGIQDIEFNASATATAVGYRYVKSALIDIPHGTEQIIIPGTRELVNREISVKLISGSRVFLVWDGMEKEQMNFLTLNPSHPTYKDTADGGIRLDAIAVDDDVELVIVVRQQ